MTPHVVFITLMVLIVIAEYSDFILDVLVSFIELSLWLGLSLVGLFFLTSLVKHFWLMA